MFDETRVVDIPIETSSEFGDFPASHVQMTVKAAAFSSHGGISPFAICFPFRSHQPVELELRPEPGAPGSVVPRWASPWGLMSWILLENYGFMGLKMTVLWDFMGFYGIYPLVNVDENYG